MRQELVDFREQIELIRARSVQQASVIASDRSNSVSAKRWRAAGVAGAQELIADAVDTTISALLRAIDGGQLRLAYLSKDGSRTPLRDTGLEAVGRTKCQTELNEFGKRLVELVRDRAIRESSVNGSYKMKRVSAAGAQGLDVVLRDVVDVTIATFLNAVDGRAVRLEYIVENGTSLDLGEHGFAELTGDYLVDWRAAFSTEPVSAD